MKILCSKYTWFDETPLKECNFFSNEDKVISPPFDLTPYLIKNSLSELVLDLENTDSENSLYKTIGNISFQLTDLFDQNIGEFFGVLYLRPRQKYLTEIIYDNGDKFIGIIYIENVDYIDPREEEIIEVTVLGFEKEFKEYYSNKNLVECTWNTLLGVNLIGFRVNNFSNILRTNIDSDFIEFDLSPEINSYLVSKNPYQYTPIDSFNTGHMFIKTGYESFRRDRCTVFDWLNSVTIPMGWVYYFENKKFVIRQRYDLGLTVQEIDYEKNNLSHKIDKELLDSQVDNIMIDAGEFYSNRSLLTPSTSNPYPGFGTVQYLGGQRKILYSQTNEFNNRILPFNRLIFNGNDNYSILYANKTNIFLDQQDQDFRFREFKVYQPSPTIVFNEFKYLSQRTIHLKPYICSKESAGCLDITNARQGGLGGSYIDIGNGNFFGSAVPPDNYDFRYTGNGAESLFKFNSQTQKYETYFDYVQTLNFSLNFSKFLHSNLQLCLIIKINKLITTLTENIKLKNYPYYDLNNKIFTVQGIKQDRLNETTELKLLYNGQ